MKNLGKTRIEIDGRKLNNAARITKARLVQDEMELVINSDHFKHALIKKLDRRPYHLGEKSQFKDALPEEIYLHLRRGAEVLSPKNDFIWQIEIDDYFSLKRVIGYTLQNIKTIFVNTRYYDKFGSKKIGSNICHEQGHKLGFKHDFWNTKNRGNSLCYLLNEVYEEVWEIMFGTNSERDLVKVCYRYWFFFRRCKYVKNAA